MPVAGLRVLNAVLARASKELVDGPQPLRWVLMLAVAVAVTVLALALFRRREIGSGQPRRVRHEAPAGPAARPEGSGPTA